MPELIQDPQTAIDEARHMAHEYLPRRLSASGAGSDAVVIRTIPDGIAACYQCNADAVYAIGYYDPDVPASPEMTLGGSFYGCSLKHAFDEIEDRPALFSSYPSVTA